MFSKTNLHHGAPAVEFSCARKLTDAENRARCRPTRSTTVPPDDGGGLTWRWTPFGFRVDWSSALAFPSLPPVHDKNS